MVAVDSIIGMRSVRSYKKKEIPEDVLTKIFEAGRHTPSSRNIQPWHFIIVSDLETKQKLAKGKARFIEDSAFVIVGCGDPEQSPRWCELEVAIAMQSMVLAAWANGVGSCWVDFDYDEEGVRQILGIPEKLRVVAMVAFGYPEKIPKPSWKKSLDQIIHYNRF